MSMSLLLSDPRFAGVAEAAAHAQASTAIDEAEMQEDFEAEQETLPPQASGTAANNVDLLLSSVQAHQ